MPDEDGLIDRLGALHSRMLDAIRQRRKFRLNIAIGQNEADAVLLAMLTLCRSRSDTELLDEIVTAALGYGVFDDSSDLWRRAARATNRDPDSGNRLASTGKQSSDGGVK